MQLTVCDESRVNDVSHRLDVDSSCICADELASVFSALSFSSSLIPVAFTDLSGKFLYSNSAFYNELLGFNAENEIQSFRIHNFFDSVSCVEQLFENVAKHGIIREKLVLVDKQGQKKKYRVSAKLISGLPENTTLPVVFSFSSLTELGYATDNFTTARLFRYKVIDAIADPLLVKDRKYRYVLMNEAFCRFMRLERAELLGKTNHELFSRKQADYFKETDDQVFDTGEEMIIEENISSPAGTEHTFIAKKTVYEDEYGDKFIVCIFRDVTAQKQAEKRLGDKQKKIASMAIELSLAEERERMRIASELHDNIGQTLILSRIKLAMLEQLEPGDEYERTLTLASDLLDEVIQRVRSLTVQISPPLLSGAGLEIALSHLARQMQKDYGLQVTFTDDKSCKPLSNELRSVVYQAARELLINVVKHADTDAASLSVWREGDELLLCIEDDGSGFNSDDAALLASDNNCSFGMFNIRQRLKEFGGRLMVSSSPWNGTVATIYAPLEQNCNQSL